jgi:hypothetical protein
MVGILKVIGVAGLLLLFGGLVVTCVHNARLRAQRVNCQNNLKIIGLGMLSFHGVNGYFPSGTVPNPALPPEKRLSWLTENLPFMIGGIEARFDRSQSWDADVNCPVRWAGKNISMTGGLKEEEMGAVKALICPSNSDRSEPSLPRSTNYIGLAGLGEQAPELPLSDPGAGFFGYDRQLSTKDILDGTSNTIAVAEVVDGGPWTAGGWATVRGIVSSNQPYLGEGGQFTSSHRGGGLLLWNRSVVTNVLFADASVRGFTPSISPQVFEALVTIVGGEEIGNLPP